MKKIETDKKMDTNLTNIILNYFSGFSAKDLHKTSRDFSQLIVLKDWATYRSGMDDVKDVIQEEIFNKVETIHILPESIHFCYVNESAIAVCKIDIIIDGSQTLKVLDLIQLYHDDNSWKIVKIEAYKQ